MGQGRAILAGKMNFQDPYLAQLLNWLFGSESKCPDRSVRIHKALDQAFSVKVILLLGFPFLYIFDIQNH